MMNPRMKSLAMVLLVMFLSAGVIKGENDVVTSPLHLLHKGGNSRKLLGLEEVLDYDYAGPNVKHEPPTPRGRKGGGGNKTP